MRKLILPSGREVEATDIDFKSIKEDWNEYELEDGSVLKFKTIISSIIRTEDYDLITGDPIYRTRSTSIVRVKVPENMKYVSKKQTKKKEGMEVV